MGAEKFDRHISDENFALTTEITISLGESEEFLHSDVFSISIVFLHHGAVVGVRAYIATRSTS